MKLAVCLLTADRPGYTGRTLETFRRFNPVGADLCLHADDGSATQENAQLAAGAGFVTVYASNTRLGQGRALGAMWGHAERLGATHILHLENDWEWVAPIPRARPPVATVRLYGTQKARSGPRAPTGTRDLESGEVVTWLPSRRYPGWERGFIHWGGPPSITETPWLIMAARAGPRIKDISMALTGLSTARPLENYVWHIGDEPTPGPA